MPWKIIEADYDPKDHTTLHDDELIAIERALTAALQEPNNENNPTCAPARSCGRSRSGARATATRFTSSHSTRGRAPCGPRTREIPAPPRRPHPRRRQPSGRLNPAIPRCRTPECRRRASGLAHARPQVIDRPPSRRRSVP